MDPEDYLAPDVLPGKTYFLSPCLAHLGLSGSHGDQVYTVKSFVKQPFSKRQKIGFQDELWLNAGQKYCRMLHVEHSAILSTFINLPFVI